MKKSTLTLFVALAMAAITPAAHALEGSIGVGISPASTFTYSDGYKPDSAASVVPSINASLRLPVDLPISIRAEYMREAAGGDFDAASNVYGLAVEYQFRDKADGIRPYVFAGAALLTEADDESLTSGRAGAGARYAISKSFELDANYSMFFHEERVGFLTVGVNYKF